MNWEKSKSLTSLKLDFLNCFFEKEQSFFLTGGSALSIFYLDHRFSYDLDLFTLENVDWHLFENELRDISDRINATLSSISTSPLFRRYQIERNREVEILDFIIEKVPQLNKKKNLFGTITVDTLDEIGVNKICTLISRSEIKDLIDLYFLSKEGFNVVEHINDSKKKDAGLSPSTLSFILDEIEIHKLPDYMIKEISVDDIKKFVSQLKIQLAEISFPEKNQQTLHW